MRYLASLTLLLFSGAVARTEGPSVISLPKAEDVFVIANSPVPSGVQLYFTPESLIEALPAFRPGEAELKVGARRVWQSGVMVLKNKNVLFWTTCRSNFIHVLSDKGIVSFIMGDGRDDH